MANPLQQPNQNAAADGNTIANGFQSLNAHQRALGTELSLFGNITVDQIQQQLATMQASINQLMHLSAAR
jgi:hypothetical protein